MDKNCIKKEIARMSKEGIIRHNKSPSRAQVLVTTLNHHKKYGDFVFHFSLAQQLMSAYSWGLFTTFSNMRHCNEKLQ